MILLGKTSISIETKNVEEKSFKRLLGLKGPQKREVVTSILSEPHAVGLEGRGIARIIGNVLSGRAVFNAEIAYQAMMQRCAVIIIDVEHPGDNMSYLAERGRLMEKVILAGKEEDLMVRRDVLSDFDIEQAIVFHKIIHFSITSDMFYLPEGRAVAANVLNRIDEAIKTFSSMDAPVMVLLNCVTDFANAENAIMKAVAELKVAAHDDGVYLVISDVDLHQSEMTRLDFPNPDYAPERDEVFIFKKHGAYLNRMTINGIPLDRLGMGEAYFYDRKAGLCHGFFTYNKFDSNDLAMRDRLRQYADYFIDSN